MNCNKLNITIVGLGLIGGSLAMAIKELGPKNLWAIDIDSVALKTAEEMKVIDKGFISPQVPLAQSDIVILAIYPQNTIDFVVENMANFKSGAIITDTAGIKGDLIKEIKCHLRADLDFLGGHPMAGKEESGLKAASKDIFKNANYILTPTAENKAENIVLITELVEAMGCKRVVHLTPAEHDDIIAYTSQLTHIIAAALMECNSSVDKVERFIGGSFKDMTRVAAINGELWPELLLLNKENILRKLEDFEAAMNVFKKSILTDDQHQLKKSFESATAKRKEIGKNV